MSENSKPDCTLSHDRGVKRAPGHAVSGLAARPSKPEDPRAHARAKHGRIGGDAEDLPALPPRPASVPADLGPRLVQPGDLAHLIDDVVECLELSAIEAVYEAELRGAPPYHPRMMTKIRLYAYAVGVTSSRRLSKLVTTSG